MFFGEGNKFICDNYLQHSQKIISPKILSILEWFSDWRNVVDIEELCIKGSCRQNADIIR